MWEFKKSFICPKDARSRKRYAEYKKYYQVKYEIAKELNPKRILEIGVRAGYSAKSFLDACPDAEYVGVDAENGTHGGQDGPWLWWAKQLLADRNATFHMLDSQSVKNFDWGTFDLIHVDGDHSEQGALHDMKLALACLAENGAILVDDYDYIPTVRAAVDRFVASQSVRHEYRKSLRGEILIRK
jgi:predicted O-methyltransferase YrrM